MTKSQRSILSIVRENPGIDIKGIAGLSNTSTSGAGLTVASLTRNGLLTSRDGGYYVGNQESKDAEKTESDPDINDFIRKLKSRVAMHSFSSDNIENKKAAYLAKVGLCRILEDLTGTPQEYPPQPE